MIRLVGMGPGNINYITMEAIELIKASEVVIAFGRIAKSAKQIKEEIYVVDRVDEIIDMLDLAKDTAILASGDPCFFGILDFLQRKGIAIDQVVPGISSMQYMMAKRKLSWQDAALVSFHGRESSFVEIKQHRTSIVLTDSKYTPNYISHLLWGKGLQGKIYSGFNLSYEDELILEKKIGEDIEDISTLAVVVIENEMA